jgi:hypothetical protein
MLKDISDDAICAVSKRISDRIPANPNPWISPKPKASQDEIVEIKQCGSIFLQAKFFSEIAKKLPTDSVEIIKLSL